MKQLIRRILKESVKEKLQKRLEQDGLIETLNTLGITFQELLSMLGMSMDEFPKKYNPFEGILSMEKLEKGYNTVLNEFVNDIPTTLRTYRYSPTSIKYGVVDFIYGEFYWDLVDNTTEIDIIPNTYDLLEIMIYPLVEKDPRYKKIVDSIIKESVRNTLLEEIDDIRKERIKNKVINVLSSSMYIKEKRNKLIFWFVSEQMNEPIFEYNIVDESLKILKGKVKNYLDIFLPESLGQDFRMDVLKTVFNNKTDNQYKLKRIIEERFNQTKKILTESMREKLLARIQNDGLEETLKTLGITFQELLQLLNLTKNEKYSLFQSMIDEAISKLKNICETMDFEDPNSEVISFGACDYLQTLIDIKIVDIPNDTTIKVRTKYDYIFAHKDDEAFIYELQIALKKYGRFKIDVEESINVKTRQW